METETILTTILLSIVALLSLYSLVKSQSTFNNNKTMKLYKQIKENNMIQYKLEEASKLKGKAFQYYDANNEQVKIVIKEAEKPIVYSDNTIKVEGKAYVLRFPQQIKTVTYLYEFINHFMLDATEIDYDSTMIECLNAKIFNIESKMAEQKNKLDKLTKKKSKLLKKKNK